MVISEQKFISEIIKEKLPNLKYCVLSGPSFAEEMVKNHPTLVTVAAFEEKYAKEVQTIVSSEFFKIYTSDDVLGVEIAGGIKNVYAIGAGIVEGSGYGYNTKAALITRSTIVNTFNSLFTKLYSFLFIF